MLRRDIAFFAPCSVQPKVLQISWRVWFAAVFAVSQLRRRGGKVRSWFKGSWKGRNNGDASLRVVVVHLVRVRFVFHGDVGGHGRG
mmetsp:Transcript_3257/g.11323  ORF Transcript_3257/g.11323 Transcript_3257/m.11323 type:complete len:86 (+) Transcript_3257:724-981(+)